MKFYKDRLHTQTVYNLLVKARIKLRTVFSEAEEHLIAFAPGLCALGRTCNLCVSSVFRERPGATLVRSQACAGSLGNTFC